MNKLKSVLIEDKAFIDVLLKTFIARLISAFGAVFLSLVIAKLAGPTEFGVYTTILTSCYFFAILGRFGLDSVLLVHGSIAVSKKNLEQYLDVKKILFSMTMLLSLVACMLYSAFSEMFYDIFFKDENRKYQLYTSSLIVLTFNWIYFQSAQLKCLNKPEVSTLLEVGAVSILSGLMLIGLKIFGVNINSQICINITLMSSLFICVLGGFALVSAKSKINFEHLAVEGVDKKMMLRDGLDFMLGNLVAFIVQWSSMAVLAIYLSSTEVGVFSLTQRLAMLTSFVLSVFNTIAANKFAILSRGSSKKELQKYIRKTTNYMVVIGGGVTLFVIIESKDILGFFGEAFVDGWVFLVVMNMAQFINVSTGSVGTLLNMSGRQNTMRNIIIITGIISIGTALYLIPKLGVWGAVIAAALSVVLQNVLAALIAYKKLSLKTYPH